MHLAAFGPEVNRINTKLYHYKSILPKLFNIMIGIRIIIANAVVSK